MYIVHVTEYTCKLWSVWTVEERMLYCYVSPLSISILLCQSHSQCMHCAVVFIGSHPDLLPLPCLSLATTSLSLPSSLPSPYVPLLPLSPSIPPLPCPSSLWWVSPSSSGTRASRPFSTDLSHTPPVFTAAPPTSEHALD